jgi:5-(carboxyamino)imidazole ribonucleotide mutase
MNLNNITSEENPLVGIVMGSDSDFHVMKEAAQALGEWNIPYELQIVSAHRTPNDMAEYAQKAPLRGLRVIIAGAGGAAHLPGMIAAFGILPVIGVPVPLGPLGGQDALYSIVQMPKGVPVATVAIGGAYNAGILAAQMITLASGDQVSLSERIEKWNGYKRAMAEKSRNKTLPPVF